MDTSGRARNVGFSVGCPATTVGQTVGGPVGLRVGCVVGVDVGFTEGLDIGSEVGTAVGDSVGVASGATLGMEVGKRVEGTVDLLPVGLRMGADETVDGVIGAADDGVAVKVVGDEMG